nr:tRNA pseudouridine(55) synthase TruB [Patescibacteria group bacterium]
MNEPISGFLLINKKSGPTSHDMVDSLRRITGIRKIGHAGTLDPFATGVLLMAIGRQATKKIDRFVKKDKTYVATLCLGTTTDTYDREGIKIINKGYNVPTKDQIDQILSDSEGEQEQIPPMFSAKKVGGKKLYELARKGIEIERKPSFINIYSINLISYTWPVLKIEVRCSTGTYIRSLAYDIGEKLGCGAYLEEL